MKKYLLLFTIALFYTISYSQQLNWTPIADFPISGRYAPFSFMIGNDFYAGSGVNNLSSSVAIDDLYGYDSISDTWVSKAAIPGNVELYAASTFTLNDGNAYVVDGELPGSYNYSSTLWQYNPTTDAWTAKAPFIGTTGYTGTSFSIGRYGFVGLTFSPYIKHFYRYDSQTDTWTQIADYPGTARQSASSFVVDGIAYVGLGNNQNDNSVGYTDFYKYDTIYGNWSPIATFPGRSRRDCASISLNGKGYIIGGIDSTSNIIYNDVWQYDPQLDAWTQLDSFAGSEIRVPAFGSNGASFAIVGMGEDASRGISNHLWKTTAINTSVTNVDQNPSRIWFNKNRVSIRFQEALSNADNFTLYDISGREISKTLLQKGESNFDISLSSISSGVYLYRVTSLQQGAEIKNGKIVVMQ